MATKTKAAKKTTTKKAPAKKAAPKKAAVRKTTSAKKAAPKSSPSPREHKAAEGALKLVDQAASILREGIRLGADSTEKTRLQAKQKAHTLLTKATGSLSNLIEDSSAALQKAISKL